MPISEAVMIAKHPCHGRAFVNFRMVAVVGALCLAASLTGHLRFFDTIQRFSAESPGEQDGFDEDFILSGLIS